MASKTGRPSPRRPTSTGLRVKVQNRQQASRSRTNQTKKDKRAR